MIVTGIHRRFGERSVIHQTQLGQTIKHRLADFFGNSAPTQGTSQLNPAAWPSREKPQTDALRLRRRTQDIAIGALQALLCYTGLVRTGSAHQKSTGAGTV
jgi:hypothetical protein